MINSVTSGLSWGLFHSTEIFAEPLSGTVSGQVTESLRGTTVCGYVLEAVCIRSIRIHVLYNEHINTILAATDSQ